MNKVIRRIASLLLPGLILTAAAPACAAQVRTEHVTAALLSEAGQVQPGGRFSAALRITPIPHWHVYWRNPGDSGAPTRIRWSLPAGWQAGEIQWPVPQRIDLAPLTNFGYEGETWHLVELSVPATAASGPMQLAARADWLVCHEVCVPETAEFTLDIEVGASPRPSTDAAAIARARAALPQPLPADAVQASTDAQGLLLHARLPQTAPGVRWWFFPHTEGLIDNPAPQGNRLDGQTLELGIKLAAAPAAELQTLSGVLAPQPAGAAPAYAFTAPLTRSATPLALPAAPAVTPSAPAAGDASLWFAALLAFGGGLLLNLMPCVLPVLSLKVFGLVRHAGASRGLLAAHGGAFFFGVLASFWVLAGLMLVLQAGGAAIGWGFQLQSPAFVAALALLFTLLALNFAGLFEVGTGLQGLAAEIEGHESGGGPLFGSFASGVLTTLVATPCTAPFLGAGIGYTLGKPPAEALLVFSAMAAGVALPVTALTLHPAWLKRVPKPGRWMLTLRQFFAFPLLATVLWLLWVFGSQQGPDAQLRLAAGLLVAALAAWVYGRFGQRPRALAVALAIGLGGAWLGFPRETAPTAQADATTTDTWQPWEPTRLAALRAAGKPVFVDFTAAWCVSCQVNKRLVLNTEPVLRAFAHHDVSLMRADWTRQDPAITEALRGLGRNAVPVYALYPADPAQPPQLLPELLTRDIVLDALATRPAVASAPPSP